MSEESELNSACGPEPCSSRTNSCDASPSATPPTRAPQRLSVYSHIEGIQEVGQLRGLRSGRRRSRFRGLQKASITLDYGQALTFLEEPLRRDESLTLVTAAIEHFAVTVSGIVEQLDGQCADATDKPDEKARGSEKEAEDAWLVTAEVCAAVEALSSPDEQGPTE